MQHLSADSMPVRAAWTFPHTYASRMLTNAMSEACSVVVSAFQYLRAEVI